MKKTKQRILKSNFLKTLLLYTLIFILLVLFILSIFNKYNKWFIWGSDGIIMHTINLKCLREILVKFVRTGFFSTFMWNTANGIDLFSNLTWYVFGDFFSYLSVFVRLKDIAVLYNVLIFLRIYFIGISFLCYAKYRKLNNTTSLIGALLFTFCSYVLYAGARHPYYMNSLIVFPLLMIGIEKIIKEDKKIFFTIIVAIAFIVNFYFAYPMSLTLAIYGTILAIKYYKKDGVKKVVQVLFKTLCYSLLGIMMSSILLLPTIVSVFNSQRIAGNMISTYPLFYYRRLAYSLLHLKNSGFWIVIGTQSLLLITLPLTIFKNRKANSAILILLLVLLLPVFFAPIGSIFMCFSFPYERWSYIFPFIFSFISASFLDKEQSISKKDLIVVFITLIVFLSFNAIMDNNLNYYMEIQLLLLFAWLVLFYFKDYLGQLVKKINLYHVALVVLVTGGIGISIKYIYDIEGHGYVSDFRDKNVFDEFTNTSDNAIPDFGDAIDYIKKSDNSFYKISKYPYAHPNVSILKKFNSTGYFTSIIPKDYCNLNLDINNSKFDFLTGVWEFDYRTKMNSFMGVKYLINYGNGIVPYGYQKIKKYKNESKIYENEYYLPFGTLYTNYITENEYNKLSPLQKENILLKATVLKSDNHLNHLKVDSSNFVKDVKYDIVDSKDIYHKNEILVTKNNQNSFKLKIDKVKNSELYVSLENLKYIPFTKEEMVELNMNEETTLLEKEQLKKKYKWYEPSTAYTVKVNYKKVSNSHSEDDVHTNPYLENFPEVLFNLGYYDETEGTIKISFSQYGKFTFDDIKVYAVPMEGYEEDINNLRKSNFEIENYDNGYLNGSVDAESNGILQFQTMYSNGWDVFVDGKEVKTLKSNKYFLGINIEKGKHKIYMKYHTPYFKEGIIVTIIGIFIFIATIVYERKKKKV